jgi:molybdopterin-guanine dinucleotide biosynthesis protein
MTFYKESILDLKTGKTTYVEFTAQELKAYKAERAILQAEQEGLESDKEAKELARQSGLGKLEALGLSPEEIAAITGA